ncbi:MAG: hypothetical protein EXS08_11535 [Planctomycetes bacterium]|nr:hypothetical protein [Planctomycetota bacterium]
MPASYRPFLLQTPLSTVIATCTEPKVIGTLADDSTLEYLASATVSMGLDSGLLPGMLLHAAPPRSGTGEVVEVGEHQATVEFRFAWYVA